MAGEYEWSQTGKFVPVKDHPNLEKDESTGTVINKDMGAYEEFKAKRARGKEFLQLKADIETLKVEVAELKKKIGA